MKTLLSILLTATLMLGLPSLSMAKGKKGAKDVNGQVTAVTDNSITVEAGKKKKAKTEVISVPAGTSIKDESGATVTLASLNGKHVTVKESSPGTAREIAITPAKKKGKKNK